MYQKQPQYWPAEKPIRRQFSWEYSKQAWATNHSSGIWEIVCVTERMSWRSAHLYPLHHTANCYWITWWYGKCCIMCRRDCWQEVKQWNTCAGPQLLHYAKPQECLLRKLDAFFLRHCLFPMWCYTSVVYF